MPNRLHLEQDGVTKLPFETLGIVISLFLQRKKDCRHTSYSVEKTCMQAQLVQTGFAIKSVMYVNLTTDSIVAHLQSMFSCHPIVSTVTCEPWCRPGP